MINCPNTAEFIISEAPAIVILFLCSCRSAKEDSPDVSRFLASLKAINSTMITAPSIMIPKSIAPKLIRLASTSKRYIMERANSSDKGITEAMTNPERRLPRIRTTAKMTIRKPRSRFSVTVEVVLAMSSLRSRKALILMPSGRVGSISATLFLTASITCLEFASLSIMTCPSTFSPSPLPVIAPNLVAYP